MNINESSLLQLCINFHFFCFNYPSLFHSYALGAPNWRNIAQVDHSKEFGMFGFLTAWSFIQLFFNGNEKSFSAKTLLKLTTYKLWLPFKSLFEGRKLSPTPLHWWVVTQSHCQLRTLDPEIAPTPPPFPSSACAAHNRSALSVFFRCASISRL